MSAAPRRGPRDVDTPWRRLRGHARWQWLTVDAAAILLLLVAVALAFWPVYGTSQLFVAVLGFGVFGIALGTVAALRRWGSGTTALATVAVWFLGGTPLVMPTAGIGVFVPTGRTLYGLLTGPVTAWRDMLTLQPPIGETFNLLAVPGLVGLLAALAATSISLRGSRPELAWVPLAAGWVVAAALGAQVAFRPMLVGVVVFAVVLLWTSYRRSHLRTSLTTRSAMVRPIPVVFGAVMLAVAIAAAGFLAPVLMPAESRTTVRQAVEPPIDLEQFPSPLQGFRANITRHESDVMFEVRGLAEGEVLRIATLDKYDGLSFQVASGEDEALEQTTFTRVGQWIRDETPGTHRQGSVQVRGYDGVWVPTMGRSTRFGFDGDRAVEIGENFFYNQGSGTGISPAGLRSGDRYTVEFIAAARPDDAALAEATPGGATLPEVSGTPDAVLNLALQWSEGYPRSGEKALAIERNLQQGFFSHGQPHEVLSLSGHSQARLAALLENPERMVGDDEQYASAMVLMARELGIPARLIYGYRGTGSTAVMGRDVAAWAELQFDDLGWVVFDPTPPKTRVLEDEDAPRPPTPRPHIENPPPPPQEPEIPPADEDMPIEPAEPPEQPTQIDWGEIGTWAAILGIPLLTVVLPVAFILGMKLRRRSRRRTDGVLANRWAGAWAEVVDRARDLGRSPSASATRSEQAEELLAAFPALEGRVDPFEVSQEADRVVFAPDEPAETAAQAYWRASGELRRGMRTSVGLPRWLASWLSTKSFRKPG